MKKSDITKLEAVEAILETLSDDEYDKLLDHGCEPMTAAYKIREMLKVIKA